MAWHWASGLLLFSIPNLSDDYVRFLWDGHLTVAGIHPFHIRLLISLIIKYFHRELL
ncbi:MAG: hypothetical protein IPH31_05610 [Lewinellaceae bacterium]|nr:hypothetical protein [Lewinellaceae bacterium]